MDQMELMEVVVKCRVPREEVEDWIIKLRRGARILPIDHGFACLDAFESGSPCDPSSAEIRALYRRARERFDGAAHRCFGVTLDDEWQEAGGRNASTSRAEAVTEDWIGSDARAMNALASITSTFDSVRRLSVAAADGPLCRGVDASRHTQEEGGFRMSAELISLDYRIPRCNTSLVEFPLLIGSANDVEIRLEDHSISPHHCEIDYTRGCLTVRDLGSLHGTFINGTRVRESELTPGDELAVGMLTFLVQGEPGTRQCARPLRSQGEPKRRQETAVVAYAT